MRINFAFRIKKIFAILFLWIFCGYFVLISFFPHVHIVEGIRIVHSHPYKKSHNNENRPEHNHSKDAFVLIQFISSILIISAVILSGVKVIRKLLNVKRITISKDSLLFNINLLGHRPRAPTF